MRIAFYMPFKPLGHPHPSGDLVIGTELFQFLRERGHDIFPISRLRTRWIYWKPWQWVRPPIEIARARRILNRRHPQIWLTYHSYYKAPDVLGPVCAPVHGIPYAIFQGVYSTKRRRKMTTMPGFYLNRLALRRAALVFTNKRRDEHNLRRLLAPDRLCYVAPGIRVDRFQGPAGNARRQKESDALADGPVILAAAMFRPGVKTEGLAQVIRSCGQVARKGHRFRLTICGDGPGKGYLQQLAADPPLNGIVHFTGRIPRDRMAAVYATADIFVFPGIQEGLGMVYLEAQASGLPVVACTGWGASEVVRHNQTGLLSAPGDWQRFETNIARLVADRNLRLAMGAAAARHALRHHDLEHNYRTFEDRLSELAAGPLAQRLHMGRNRSI